MNYQALLNKLETATLQVEYRIMVLNRFFKLYNIRRFSEKGAPYTNRLAREKTRLVRINHVYTLVRDRYHFGI